MLIGIGVDLLHLPRISALVRRRGTQRLAQRILSPRELVEFHSLEPEAAVVKYLANR